MKLLTKNFDFTASSLDAAITLRGYIKNKHGSVKMYLKSWSGTRRHMTLIETHHNRMIDFLAALGCKYNTGNDAPRGGVTGDYIEVKVSDAKKALIKFNELTLPYPRKVRELNRQLSYMN